MDDGDGGQKPLRASQIAVALIQIGSMLTGCVVVGLFAGYGLDRVTGLTPLFLFLGLALGILAASAGAYRLVRAYLQQ